ncbi:MAG: choice-of-anchor D domain-containing protein, partial [Myxococcales bacterium]|nr:choice-of-anchor D domain-containing protein [Myxococcales bacterium]
MFRSLREFSAALGFVMLASAAASCGNGLEVVKSGELRCVDSPCELDFGEVNLTRPGATAKVRITNAGDGPLELRSLAISETSDLLHFSDATVLDVYGRSQWQVTTDGHDFSNTSSEFTIAPGDRLELEIVFDAAPSGHGCPNPGEAGPVRCGYLTVVSSDVISDTGTLEIPILLSVGGSRLEVDPTVLSFSPPQLQDAGTYATQVRQFTVQNVGTGTMQVSSIEAEPSAELVVSDQSGSLSLPAAVIAGGSREFTVTWTPTSDEPLEGSIRVSSTAASSPTRVISVNSDGGDQPVLRVDPCSYTLGEVEVGSTGESLFTVANDGNAAMTWSLTIVNVRPSSARTALSVQTTANEPVSGQQDVLAIGESMDLKLVYAPTEAGSVSGEISFRGNFGASRSCPFVAGDATAIASIAPTEIYWGDSEPGSTSTRTFVVSNQGLASLEVSSIEKSNDGQGEFTLRPLDSGGFTLGPGESRRIPVTYTRAAGDVPAQDRVVLAVNHNAAGGVTLVNLIATHGAEYVEPTCDLGVDPPAPY